jgi:hypothetical protein
MQIALEEVTIAEIDEALAHLRNKLQDRYGNRLTYQQKQFYLSSVDDLLDARNSLTGGNRESSDSRTIS